MRDYKGIQCDTLWGEMGFGVVHVYVRGEKILDFFSHITSIRSHSEVPYLFTGSLQFITSILDNG